MSKPAAKSKVSTKTKTKSKSSVTGKTNKTTKADEPLPLSQVLAAARSKSSPQKESSAAVDLSNSSTKIVDVAATAIVADDKESKAEKKTTTGAVAIETKTASTTTTTSATTIVDPIVITPASDEDERLKALGLFSGGVKAGQDLSAEEKKQKVVDWYAKNPFYKRSMMCAALNRLTHEFWTKPCKIACWFCGYKFFKSGLNPIPMPVKYQQSVFTVEGVYCSFTCVKSKIMLDPGYYLNERLECLTLMLRDVYCYYDDVTTVCREIFKRYGGDITHKQYLANQAVTGAIKIVGSPFVQAPTIIENGFVDVLLQRPKILRPPPPTKVGNGTGTGTVTGTVTDAKTNEETKQVAPTTATTTTATAPAPAAQPTSSLLSPSFAALGFKPAQLSSFYSSAPSSSSSSSSTAPPKNFSDMVPTLNKQR